MSRDVDTGAVNSPPPCTVAVRRAELAAPQLVARMVELHQEGVRTVRDPLPSGEPCDVHESPVHRDVHRPGTGSAVHVGPQLVAVDVVLPDVGAAANGRPNNVNS